MIKPVPVGLTHRGQIKLEASKTDFPTKLNCKLDMKRMDMFSADGKRAELLTTHQSDKLNATPFKLFSDAMSPKYTTRAPFSDMNDFSAEKFQFNSARAQFEDDLIRKKQE